MREFFYNLLTNLDKLTGMKQYEKMLAAPDSKKEINDLLDILCRVSDQFPLIPKKDQKSIIRQAVISDGEFIGLNGKIVYKWLNLHRDKYFREAAHIPTEQDPNWKPVEGEARQKWLQEWAKSLEGFEDKMVNKESHVKKMAMSLPAKTENYYPPTSEEYLMQRSLHLEYVKANYDARTGKPLDTWMEESEWLKLKGI